MKISDPPTKRGQLRWVMWETAEPVSNTDRYTPRSVPILQVAEYPDGEAVLVWRDVPMALDP